MKVILDNRMEKVTEYPIKADGTPLSVLLDEDPMSERGLNAYGNGWTHIYTEHKPCSAVGGYRTDAPQIYISYPDPSKPYEIDGQFSNGTVYWTVSSGVTYVPGTPEDPTGWFDVQTSGANETISQNVPDLVAGKTYRILLGFVNLHATGAPTGAGYIANIQLADVVSGEKFDTIATGTDYDVDVFFQDLTPTDVSSPIFTLTIKDGTEARLSFIRIQELKEDMIETDPWVTWDEYFDTDASELKKERTFWYDFKVPYSEATVISIAPNDPSGSTMSMTLAILRAGNAFNVSNPQKGLQREFVSHDIEIEKLDASVYRRKRRSQAAYSGELVLPYDNEFYKVMLYVARVIGTRPLLWQIVDNMGASTTVFGGLYTMKETLFSDCYSRYSFQIKEEI